MSEADAAAVVAAWTGIPVQRLTAGDAVRLQRLPEALAVRTWTPLNLPAFKGPRFPCPVSAAHMNEDSIEHRARRHDKHVMETSNVVRHATLLTRPPCAADAPRAG